jgi:hypothetical protein
MRPPPSVTEPAALDGERVTCNVSATATVVLTVLGSGLVAIDAVDPSEEPFAIPVTEK